VVGDIISELDGITLYSAAQVSHVFIDHHFPCHFAEVFSESVNVSVLDDNRFI
jgi:hypothetical protein